MNIMQDQPLYNITPEQGWARMKPALDEAMPTGRSSRRYGWWWMSSLVLVASVIGFTYLNDSTVSSDHKPAASHPSPSELKAEAESLIPAASQISKAHTHAPDLPNDISTHYKSGIEESPVTPSSPKSQKPPKSAKSPLSEKNVNPKSGGSLPSQNAKVAEPMASTTMPGISTSSSQSLSAQDALEESISSVSSGIITENQASDLPANRTILLTQPVPGIEEMAFEGFSNRDLPGHTTTANKLKPRPHLLEPYLYINALAGINQSSGWSSGAGVNINVGRKLSLVTAAGYMRYNPNTSLVGGTKQLDANVAPSEILNYDPIYNAYDPYVVGLEVNRAAGYSTIAPLVDYVTQWQWSVGVKWKWTPRLYSDAGVTLGFATSAYTRYPIFNVDPLTTPGTEVTSGNSLSDYNVVRTNTTSAYLGFGYRIGRHFDVFTQWTHAFDHYLDVDTTKPTTDVYSEERTDYIRGLNLGLRFTL